MNALYSRRFALVTMSLLVLNLAVFGWELTLPSDGERLLANCLRPEILVGAVQDLDAPVFWDQAPRVFTAMFMHGSVSMLCVNMLFLVLTGLYYERLRGGVWLACVFFGGALAGVITDGIANSHPGVPVLGSGAGVSAVFGAYALSLLLGRVQLQKRNKVIVLVLIAGWVMLTLFGLVREAMGSPVDNIVYCAITSSFVFGLVAEAFKGRLVAAPALKQ